MERQCAYPNCAKTTDNWLDDGWAHIGGEGSVWPEGYYCPEHAEEVERIEFESLDKGSLN